MEAKKNSSKQLGPKRSLFLSVGLCLSLFIVFSAFQLKQKSTAPIPLDFESSHQFPVIVEVIATRFEQPKPPKPPAPILISIDADPEILELDLPDVPIHIETDNLQVTDFIEPPEEIAPEPTEFIPLEQQASFPGGRDKWQRYLQKNLKYPRQAQRMNIEGKVLLSFYVDTDGNISDIKVLRGIGAGCDEEAKRVLEKSPKWNPGLQRGNAVKSPMSIFIRFRLK